jgi:hypothetical protein
MFFSQHPSYTCHRMSSTWVIHFSDFFNCWFLRSSMLARVAKGLNHESGFDPRQRTIRPFHNVSKHPETRMSIGFAGFFLSQWFREMPGADQFVHH